MSRRYRLPRFNDQILSEIIFGIENQDVDYMLDISTGTLYSPEFSEGEVPSEENLIDLPPWRSADGYQLMVAFTNACQDHELKRKLVNELNSKERGVFRRFRDVLASEPEVLKQWYDFKDHRMKSYIKSWYRDHFSSEKETDELEDDELSEGELLADFEVIHLEHIDQYCEDLLKNYSKDDPVKEKILDSFSAKEAFEVVCDGKPCGALIYERVKGIACILYYYIERDDREMGLFSLMFDLFNRELERCGIDRVVMPFGQESMFLKQSLSAHDVTCSDASESVYYSVSQWNKGNESVEFAYVL